MVEMGREAQGYASAMGLSKPAAAGPLKFGKFDLDPSQVFFASDAGLSLAIVNLKPLVPGHVMVIPRRVAPRMGELTAEELEDLWRTVRHVQGVVQEFHGASCATLGVQDGKDAGQSVPHVHVHILPVHGARSSL
uniref:HIT domain-containing protein n=1 Tax=Strombidinopsis acuminata TaxID=141414 RepID=A0A7S3RNF9_9SPIT